MATSQRRWIRGLPLLAALAVIGASVAPAPAAAQPRQLEFRHQPRPNGWGSQPWQGRADDRGVRGHGWRDDRGGRGGDDGHRGWGDRRWSPHDGWRGGWGPDHGWQGGWRPSHGGWHRPGPVWVPPHWAWNGWGWVLEPGYWQ